MNFETGALVALLERALTSGAAAAAVYLLLDQPFMDGFVLWLEKTSGLFTISASQLKRWFAIVLATGLSLGIYMALVYLGVGQMPDPNFEAWADLIIWLGGLAFAFSQMVHARDL